MILEMFSLVFFTFFLIMGVHAVTRPDKLLSFLGVYIKEEIELKQLSKYIEKDLLELQQSFFDDYNLLAKFDKISKLELLSNYNEARETLINIDDEVNRLQKIVEKKRKRKTWKILSKIAPMLTECVTCMSSFWSVVVISMHFTQAFYFEKFIPVIAIFIPFVVAGVIDVVSKLASQDLEVISEAIKDLSNEQY